jgi:hypothetical protein
MENLEIPVETGFFKDTPPPYQYSVLTPMTDQFDMFADNLPEQDIKNVKISLFKKENYLEIKKRLEDSLLEADFTVNQRYYIEYEPDTGFHHYAVDVSKNYETSEIGEPENTNPENTNPENKNNEIDKETENSNNSNTEKSKTN